MPTADSSVPVTAVPANPGDVQRYQEAKAAREKLMKSAAEDQAAADAKWRRDHGGEGLPGEQVNANPGTVKTDGTETAGQAEPVANTEKTPSAWDKLGNYKWMAGLGTLGFIIGSRSNSPIFRFLGTLFGLVLGAVKDGANGLLGAYMADKTNNPASIHNSATPEYPGQNLGQTQTNAPAPSAQPPAAPPAEFVAKMQEAKSSKKAFSELERGLSELFVSRRAQLNGEKVLVFGIGEYTLPAVPVAVGYVGVYGGNPVVRYNHNLSAEIAREKARAVSFAITDLYKGKDFRTQNAEQAAASVIADPRIQFNLQGDQRVTKALYEMIKANHDGIIQAVQPKIEAEKAANKLPKDITAMHVDQAPDGPGHLPAALGNNNGQLRS